MKAIFGLMFVLTLLVGVVSATEVPPAESASASTKVTQPVSQTNQSSTVGEEKHKGFRVQLDTDETGGVDVEKLNPEDQADIAKHAMSSPVAIIGVFIPIVAIVMSIGLVMIIIWLEYKRRRQQNEIVREAVAKGLTPPEFPEKKKDPVRTGIILMAFGLGIGLAIGITSEELRTGALGLVLFIPGIGYLIYGLMRRNGQSNSNQ